MGAVIGGIVIGNILSGALRGGLGGGLGGGLELDVLRRVGLVGRRLHGGGGRF